MVKSNWKIDTAHSSLEFVVKHMMMSKAKGYFNDFTATVQADPENLTDAEISVSIDANSINTRNEKRDGHLRSSDFFDVENHPNLTFTATKIVKTGDNEYDITGDFTIRETTKPVTFHMTQEGIHKDPMSGNTVAGFSGNGKINRKDFGLTWNAALETGGVLVGDEVKINIEIEAHQEA